MTADDPDPASPPMTADDPDPAPSPMTADDPDPRPAPARLDVVVTDGRGRPRAAGDLPAWLAGVAPRSAAGQAVVALVCDRKMRDLNRRFRGVDRVTDVLSFPAEPDDPDDSGASGAGAGGGPRWLGDIVIATGRAARQARAAGLTESEERRRLALHGLLHLLGYDHERDDGRMRRLERRLQRRGGLPVDAS